MSYTWRGRPVDAVIFDHDGTLVDSETTTAQLLATMAAEIGVMLSAADGARFVGSQLGPVIDEIVERSPTGVYDHDSFLAAFRSRQTALFEAELTEIPGAAKVLSELQARAVPFAVASNAPRAKMELCLGATGLRQFFADELLISAYEIEAWKPEPDLFLHAAERLGIDPARCLVVEDSRPGLQAGLAARMRVVAIDPTGVFADLPGLESITDLVELLGG